MRESKIHGERSKTRNSDEVNCKYFLLFEGTKTEPLYFDSLNENKSIIGISPLIQLVKLERDSEEKTWSNPKKLLYRILLVIKEPSTGITYSTLINAMVDCLYESEWLKKHGTNIDEFDEILHKFYVEKLGKKPEEIVVDQQETVYKAIDFFRTEKPRICELILSHFAESLDDRKITFDSSIDKICLIVDRDSKSFTVDQYDYVVKTCQINKVQLYISNPCFEFWLLLHYDVLLSLDKTMLLENAPISSSNSAITYLEVQLSKKLSSYNKNRYKVEELMRLIDHALINENNFCEDIQDLKTKLGCNIGLLIRELKER